ncbi:MAG: LD-carboxypeptidase [Comamonas sp. SCN 65-56]|uniref:LD-carboxypeptidase n=1 Tax=Comamonas sp. SCN 65-56 TaxID=1660095 RepID=UPI00086C8A9C|nr:LD-carboxypeptidase [Comamonas sp. SCN 65-56]ODS92340.1 MAG: LD-carboxypeptidase [Comamonas sp. SCN 65-56]
MSSTQHHDHCSHHAGAQHIYVYSPSGAVRDKAALRRAVKRLQQLGHEVELDPDALASHTRFAGDDATRLAAIHRAAASGADVAMMTRGGYGLTRLLPEIRYKQLAKAIERGTRFVGMSDFTALQMALLARTGAGSWAGPLLCADLGTADEPDEIMLACLQDLFSGEGEGTGWRLPRDSEDVLAGRGLQGAQLWGGNLAVLCALVGTPWLPPIQGGVLFLEDVGEHPYRIERMLTQLLYAGVLARQKAILLGQFTDYRRTPHDKGFTLATLVAWLRQHTRVPVLTGLPFGHVPTKVVLPVGAKVALAVEGRDALMLWGHIH